MSENITGGYLVCNIRKYIYNNKKYWVIAHCDFDHNNQGERYAYIRFWFRGEDGSCDIDLGDNLKATRDTLFKLYLDVLSRCDLSTSIRNQTTHKAWPIGSGWANMLLELPFNEWYFINQLISNGTNTLSSIMGCFQLKKDDNNTTYTIDNDYIDRCLQYISKPILGIKSGMSNEVMYQDYILQRFITSEEDLVKYTLTHISDNDVLYHAIPEKLYPICAYVVSNKGEHYENNFEAMFEIIIENKIPFNDTFVSTEEYLPILEHYIRNIDGMNKAIVTDLIKKACYNGDLEFNISIYERIAQQLLDVEIKIK